MDLQTILSNPIVMVVLAQLIVGVFGWVISWFTSDAEARTEQSSPFFAGLMNVLRGVGIDPPKVLAGLRDMLLAVIQRHPAQLAAKARRAQERGVAEQTALLWTAGIGLLMMAGMLVLLSLNSCATAKQVTCPLIDLADKACPYVIMQLGDGTSVRVPRGRAEALAKQEAALQGLTDGGK
jgi:hypothetical protein